MKAAIITINSSIIIAIMNVPNIIGGAMTKLSTSLIVVAVLLVISVVGVKTSLVTVLILFIIGFEEVIGVVKFIAIALVVRIATTEDGIEAVGLILMTAERSEISAAS